LKEFGFSKPRSADAHASFSFSVHAVTIDNLCIPLHLKSVGCVPMLKPRKKLSIPVAALFDVFFATGILGQALAPSVTGDAFFLKSVKQAVAFT
jgi:hypothetical protein